MSHFSYQDGALFAEKISLTAIAKQFGTPTYVYSKAALLENFMAYANACNGHDALVCYAMKANSYLAILNLLTQHDAGLKKKTNNKLQRVIAAGGDPKKCLFSGVG